jgi:hypothetical protein
MTPCKGGIICRFQAMNNKVLITVKLKISSSPPKPTYGMTTTPNFKTSRRPSSLRLTRIGNSTELQTPHFPSRVFYLLRGTIMHAFEQQNVCKSHRPSPVARLQQLVSTHYAHRTIGALEERRTIFECGSATWLPSPTAWM